MSFAANQYLAWILKRYSLPSGPASPAVREARLLLPALRSWSGPFPSAIRWTGSYAKGTRVSGATDIDVFVSLRAVCPGTLKQIFESLVAYLRRSGLDIAPGNVAVAVTVNGFHIDVVPGRKQRSQGTDHSLYRRRGDTWIQTNPDRHVRYVLSSRRANEIRLTKIWRNLNGLDFPSFYLELAVLQALRGRQPSGLAANFASVLEYLATDFSQARIVDPANSNNVVSDELTAVEKNSIARLARVAASAQYWEAVVW